MKYYKPTHSIKIYREDFLPFLNNVFFIFWIVSLMVLITFAYLTQFDFVDTYRDNFDFLLKIHIIFGGLFIVSGVVIYAEIIYELLKPFKTLIFVLTTVVVFYTSFKIVSSQSKNIVTTSLQRYAEVFVNLEKTYLTIFYDAFGNLTDSHMATESELLQEVNNYRVANQLSTLQQDNNLCIIGKEKLDQLNSTLSYTTLESSQITNEKNVSTGEIIQVLSTSSTAPHIVQYAWTRSYKAEKNILDNPSWRSGCAVVNKLSIAFIMQ